MLLKNNQFKKYSKIVCDNIVDVDEGEKIGDSLLVELNNSTSGIGLAAPQIGLTKQVCVINVKDTIVLVNPQIVEKSEETFPFAESCLSYPGKRVKTKRYVEVTVEADNHEGQLFFSADSKDIKDALECVCVQHEIDHLNGVTMFDRKYVQEPYRAPKKYGRNEKVVIMSKDNKMTRKLKWKKAQPLINTGDWSIMSYHGQGPIPQ